MSLNGIWGIVCDANNKQGVEKLYTIKQSRNLKLFSILLSNENEIPYYFNQKNLKVFDYIIGVGKPNRVIYNGVKNLAPNAISKDTLQAVQIIEDYFYKVLIKNIRHPLLFTKARIARNPIPLKIEEVDLQIMNNVDYVSYNFLQTEANKKYESTVKWHPDGSIEIIHR